LHDNDRRSAGVIDAARREKGYRVDVNGVAAIVTGGGSGIGAASARALSKLGARCVVLDRDATRGTSVAGEIGGVFAEADVADEAQVQAAVDAAAALAPIRVLVNAAGIASATRTVDREGVPFPLDKFERVVRVNLLGTFNCLRLTAAAMAKSDPVNDDGLRGSIVNVASVAAFDGQTGQAAYSASKSGVVGLTLPVARDLAAIGVRVNTIAPGLIDTPIYGAGEQADAFKTHLAGNVLFPRRLGTAEELASMVVEVLTNDYMNGETIRVDGGARLAAK
jgi:NAD(P)-dependent dehydrogenase (short-subunit alcohol dehydrogenase family)